MAKTPEIPSNAHSSCNEIWHWTKDDIGVAAHVGSEYKLNFMAW